MQGEQLGSTEATEVFFAMTKLFQSKDVVLRRMVYLGIKELSSLAEDVIIVTSSLTKDMTGREDLYRAAAIRALCSITDVSVYIYYYFLLTNHIYYYYFLSVYPMLCLSSVHTVLRFNSGLRLN